jgi:hypothetical protein
MYNMTECGVCYDETEVTTKCCNQSLCFTCLDSWKEKSKSCPYCRTIITSNNDIHTLNKNETKYELRYIKNRIKRLEELYNKLEC